MSLPWTILSILAAPVGWAVFAYLYVRWKHPALIVLAKDLWGRAKVAHGMPEILDKAGAQIDLLFEDTHDRLDELEERVGRLDGKSPKPADVDEHQVDQAVEDRIERRGRWLPPAR
jgi:hypothetical protein